MTKKEQYRKICEARNDIPVFLQCWWLDAVCGEYWDVAIAQKGEHITGVWPYHIASRGGVGILRNPKLTPYLGPHVFFPGDIKQSNADGFEHETVSELLAQIPKTKVWHLAMQPGFKQAGIMKNQGLEVHVQQTFLIDLKTEELTLFGNLKENLRRNLRATEKEFEITNDPKYINELYGFQQHTLKGKGVMQAHTLPEMERLMQACLAHSCAALWVAKEDKEVQAIVWNVWDSERSYYFMGAQNPASDSNKAMSHLLWHAIKESAKRGNTIFDMEGSMDPGVERFFRGFGGKRELYMVVKKNESLLWKLKELVRG